MQDSEKMYGVEEGVRYQQDERVEDLNNRIQGRQFPDYPLEPNYQFRPVPTKYSRFPIVERRASTQESRLNYPDYNQYGNFNPGSAVAPITGFLRNVDTETILRNQTFSLQNYPQNVYIPTSKSDLYNVTVVSRPTEQPYPLLFEKSDLEKNLHPNIQSSEIGKNIFFNPTRVQLRNGM
jgi:hypothetical protein